jgi:sulfite exporter TauE/SafE
MNSELALLLGTAATIGVVHTLLGPDHYLPFIAMSRALRWSAARTAWITLVCGLGHVLGSVALGFLGIGLGLALTRLEFWESYRGDLAAWLLIAFGLAYGVWGLRRAARNRPHEHVHVHEDGIAHSHAHTHLEEHSHAHESNEPGIRRVTPWVLFTIFVFGPCEPLIPVLMYPAAKHSALGVVLVTAVFSAVTIGTMLAIVLGMRAGLMRVSLAPFERYMHAFAGAAILVCGLAIQFLGL